jgi:phage tail sheath protein FI
MPAALSYPGVYIEEIPSGVHTITGVGTSIAAFIGRALRGPTDEATTINGFGDFERIFGGLWSGSALGYAVRDFYLNGGTQAIIVRLFGPDGALDKTALTAGDFTLEAAYPGSWGRNLRFNIDTDISDPVATAMGLPTEEIFNLTVREVGADGATVASEQFRNVTVTDGARRVDEILETGSDLVHWKGDWPDNPPDIPAIHDAFKKREDAKKELKTQQDAKDEDKIKTATEALKKAEEELADKTTDQLSKLDVTLAAAKKALVVAKNKVPQVPKEISDAQTAVKDAQDALAAASKTSDGAALKSANFLNGQADKKGIYALNKADLFNILCIPPYTAGGEPDDANNVVGGGVDNNTVISAAAKYCEDHRAILLVDPRPGWNTKDSAKNTSVLGTTSKNAALFFPHLRQPDPLRGNQMENFAPCGAVAGIFARTDTTRGVWKAPAGLEATLVGVPELRVALTDAENGELNPLGVNCLRTMPAAGRIIWGSRTLQGDDRLASEWKYIPVRRTALFIEESLYRGTQWVVFEPNDEPLWAQIRLNVGAFMQSLFRQGAFQGKTPAEAYFVKCDKETTTPDDVNHGIVNVLVGFAPLKPAEFVVIKLQQIAGQIQT